MYEPEDSSILKYVFQGVCSHWKVALLEYSHHLPTKRSPVLMVVTPISCHKLPDAPKNFLSAAVNLSLPNILCKYDQYDLFPSASGFFHRTLWHVIRTSFLLIVQDYSFQLF